MQPLSQSIQLGFLSELPDAVTYIYVGATEGTNSTWYFYDPETESKNALEHKGLAGHLQQLRLTVKEFKGKPNYKLDTIIQADRRYCIRSGLETNFSRALLLALATLNEEQLTNALVIAPRSGGETIFASVYNAFGMKVKAEWNSEIDLHSLVNRINQKLGIETQQQIAGDLESFPNAKNNGSGSYDRSIAKSNGNGSKAGAIDVRSHPHNVRVKQIRTALGYNHQQVGSWFQELGYSLPEQAPEEVIDKFAQTFCVSWAIHCNYFQDVLDADKSYLSFLEQQTASGIFKTDAALKWVEQLKSKATLKKEEIPF